MATPQGADAKKLAAAVAALTADLTAARAAAEAAAAAAADELLAMEAQARPAPLSC